MEDKSETADGRGERSEGSKRSQREAREERIAGQTTGEFLGSLRGKYRGWGPTV